MGHWKRAVVCQNFCQELINWKLIRSLLCLSMPGPHNEPPSMAGASGARFLSPVMSISSRTINLGNNGDSQHLESHYVHENSLTEQEKSGIKNLFNLASEKNWVLSTRIHQSIDSKCFVQTNREENAISKPVSNAERERS